MTYVLDASAMLAILHDERGADAVAGIITEPESVIYAHAVNLCEVYYWTYRNGGASKAMLAMTGLQALGIETRSDMDEHFWHDAGIIKANHRLSLADAFAIALARRVDCQLVTSDHHELDALAAVGICQFLFFR